MHAEIGYVIGIVDETPNLGSTDTLKMGDLSCQDICRTHI